MSTHQEQAALLAPEEDARQESGQDLLCGNPGADAPDNTTGPGVVLARLITASDVGGVILFANNLENQLRIGQVTAWYSSLAIAGDVKLSSIAVARCR